jgi:5-methylcytosine-specific restriction endonuclease McrA
MPKLCRCGEIVKDRCLRCYPHKKRETSREGYGSDHRKASEWLRRVRPLCERCVMLNGPVNANTSTELHHIVKIADNPQRRMDRNNWLAVCNGCHNEVEGNVLAGMTIRQWSDVYYDKVLRNAWQEESLPLKLLSN